MRLVKKGEPVMKNIVILFFTCALILFSSCSQDKTALPLNESLINEAIIYGRDNASLSDTEFISDWTVVSGTFKKGEGRATIITPFLRTALMSKKSASMRGKVDHKLIEAVLRKESEFISFEITLYGNSPQFARTVNFALTHGSNEYKPAAQFMPSYAEVGRDYTCSAVGWVKFEKQGIPDDATVILSVSFVPEEYVDKTAEIDFQFDLQKYR